MTLERVFDFSGGRLPLWTATGPLEDPHLSRDPQRQVLEYVPLAHGLALEADCRATITWEGEAVAEVLIGAVDGRPAATAIRALPGRQLSTQVLRNMLGLGKLVRHAAGPATVYVCRVNGKVAAVRPLEAAGSPFLDAGRQELLEAAEYRRVDDDFLRQVAEVYRDARAAGRSTQRAIQEQLGPTSDANARRWVARARKAGFLGAAPGRTGGEQPPTRKQAKGRKR